MTRPEVQQITDGGERSFSRVMHRRTGTHTMSDIAEELFGYRTEVKRLEAEIERLRSREAACCDLHHAYLRLRAMIPGAFKTPYAPTPEQVWETTENALRAALKGAQAMTERDADG